MGPQERFGFEVHVTVHRDKFLKIEPTRCTNFANFFWSETLHVSDSSPVHQFFTLHTAVGIYHTGLLTACKQDQDGTAFYPDPACKQSANLYDIYHWCVCSEKLLMIDRGTVRNM